MRRLWLIFSQAATIAVAVLFVVSTFRPEWLPSRTSAPPAILQSARARGTLLPEWLPARTRARPAITQSAPAVAPLLTRAVSYGDAVQRATVSVVNISTTKEIRAPRHPLLNDPIFRRFFGDQLPDA